jgi:hypothetical protein
MGNTQMLSPTCASTLWGSPAAPCLVRPLFSIQLWTSLILLRWSLCSPEWHPECIFSPGNGLLCGNEEPGPRSDQRSQGIGQDMQISWGTSGDWRFYHRVKTHKSILKTQWHLWSIMRTGLEFTDNPSWDLITKLETDTQEFLRETINSGSRWRLRGFWIIQTVNNEHMLVETRSYC